MSRLFVSSLLIASLCHAASAEDVAFPKIEPPPYLETLLNRPYANPESFKTELEGFKSPWRELFDGVKDSEEGQVIAPYDKLESVQIVHQTSESAIVAAFAGRNRVSYCAVIFLLTKNGGDLEIADIIRRTAIGYSCVEQIEVMPFKPEKYIHLHLSTYHGGRHWGWTSDEFFIVKNDVFKPTLALRDGFTMFPARPYDSFDQDAEIKERDGRLGIRVTRTWALDGGEQKQEFGVDFRWNPRAEKWESPDIGKIILKEPSLWSGEKLPKPPKIKTRQGS